MSAKFLKYAWVLILLVAVIAAGVFIYFRTEVPVKVVKPSRGPAVEAVYATGVVEPVLMARIAPLHAGRLASILRRDGETVAKGEALARLDDREARGNLAQLVARRDFLREEKKRQHDLYQKNFISRQGLDRTESELKQAEAALLAAQKPLAETSLVSPMDGIVLRQDGEAGEMTAAGQVLFTVGKPDHLRINADVDEEDIPRVSPGQRALIKADAFLGQALEGKVVEITPKGDSLNKNYRVRIALPNDTPLKIGMTTEVNIIVQARDNAWLVPAASINEGKVWTINDGKAHLVPVKTGIKGKQKVEILSGLSGDETLIANPPQDLKPGAKLKVQQD